MTKKNYTFIGGLAVALLLPLSFYMIARLMSKDTLHLPKYYRAEGVQTKTVDGKQSSDTQYHHVADLVLTNQLGRQVSLNNDLPGKVLVIDFIFTNCNSTCPGLTNDMALLQRAFKKNTKVESSFDTIAQFISITVDPVRDSFQALRIYADAHKVNHDHWWFLTGSKETIYNYARNELGLSLQPGNGGAEDFIHTQKFVVVDQQRYIRGYYDGLDSAEIRRCADDIVLLSLEKKKKKY